MRKLFLFWLHCSICVSLLFCSCSDEYIKGTYIASSSEYYINISTSDLQGISAAGGAVKTRIEATSAVNWEIQGLPSWLTATSLNGTGSMDVSFNVDANESFTSSRTHIFNIVTTNSDWKLTIPVSVTQQKKAKEMTISPSDDVSLTFDSKGGQRTLSITSNVAWNAECKEDFVHLSQSSAVQDLNMIVSVDAYDQIDVTQKRTATIFFKEATEGDVLSVITITQTPLQTSYSTKILTVEFNQNTNSKSFVLGNLVGGYSVSSDAQWLKIFKNQDRDVVDVTLSVEQNENDDTRTANAYVYLSASSSIGYTFSVSQKGDVIEINPKEVTIPATDGSCLINVSTSSNWQAGSDADWISLQKEGSICRVLASENISIYPRTAQVVLGRKDAEGNTIGKTTSLKVTQEAKFITLNSHTLQFGPEASSLPLSIESDANWTISSDASWIKLSRLSGFGNTTIDVSVMGNLTSSPRTGKLILKCLEKNIEIDVVQNSPYINTETTAIVMEAKGGVSKLSLSANAYWTVTSSESWLTCTPNEGNSDAVLDIRAFKNVTSDERHADLSISSLGRIIKVNVKQEAPALEISKNSISFGINGGTSGPIIVTTGYEYSISSQESWLHVNKKDNTFSITADVNKVGPRVGYIAVSLTGITGDVKRVITVSQEGDNTSFVDLGLPSGTTWASLNKGASDISENGTSYTGPESDNYLCPSYDQMQELRNNCKWEVVNQGKASYWRVTGPNGNSIYFLCQKWDPSNGYVDGNGIWIKWTGGGGQYCLWPRSVYAPLLVQKTDDRDNCEFSIREVR